MPKQVDHSARREAIVLSALSLLASRGPSGLTIRALARELKGSTALVMHYFPTREAVVEGVVDYLLAEWQSAVDELQKQHPSRSAHHLRSLLIWMLPAREQARFRERARLSLQAASAEDRKVGGQLLRTIDDWMRRVLDDTLSELIGEPQRRQRTIDLLRTTVAGVVLLNAERPEDWPPPRQIAVIDDLLESLGLSPDRTGLRPPGERPDGS